MFYFIKKVKLLAYGKVKKKKKNQCVQNDPLLNIYIYRDTHTISLPIYMCPIMPLNLGGIEISNLNKLCCYG